MKNYKLINNCMGWAVFVIASIVYLMTAEPTASWWDCGEYIATSAKIQVGHPPGAPTFQVIGRIFSFFAGGDTTKIAYMINAMSALSSAFTILFLFWSITMLAKKFVKDQANMTKDQMIAIFGSALVGSLAYTFSDTFWYSAVEGEVYAMSSCFTAIVFWAILKWDEQADDSNALRWIVLIAFLIGVAIGVHLLNILTIPAITYIVYYRKAEKVTPKGLILVGLLSIVLVGLVMYLIIPQIVNFASYFEVFFVNSLGMPFNVGTIVWFLLLAGALVYGLIWSKKKAKPLVNTAILSVLMLIIGYSTFFILVIRANSNTPINENAPKDSVALLTYLNREQYGYTPLLYGPYYNATVKQDYNTGGPMYKTSTKYVKNTEKGEYDKVIRTSNPVWDDAGCTIFPRMYSTDESRRHPQYYKMWAGIPESQMGKPTFGQNLTYFFRYQVNHMYWRYFLWNFVGRQNDVQSYGLLLEPSPADASNGRKDLIHGNWISGIKFIDEARLGPQDNLPQDLQENKGRNKLYFLPLILGLVGLVYHLMKDKRNAFVVFLLFFMTGLAIVLYLNQPPCQPRERDYAYAGSFYAFAIWIGLGVYALCDWIKKIKVPENIRNISVTAICLLAVPVLMACQEWDDHDRSNRYMARDFAANYLNSCDENSIIISFGDNDTFPLWYAQEVEGIRTDVRVLNYTLSGMAWYVEQLYNKIYESDKIKFTLDKSYYALGQDLNFAQNSQDTMELEDALKNIITSDNKQYPYSQIMIFQNYERISTLPSCNFKISFDKAKLAEKGLYPKDMVDGEKGEFVFSLNTAPGLNNEFAQLYRQELMLLDILGSNHFERPIYVMNPTMLRDIIPNIMNHVIQEGLVYKIVPYETNREVNVAKGYDLMMNKFTWGNVNKEDVYNETAVTIGNSKTMRQNHVLLANELTKQGKKKQAIEVLDKAVKEFPNNKVAFVSSDVLLAESYYNAGAKQKAHDVYKTIIDYYKSYINYYNQFTGSKAQNVEGQKNFAYILLAQLHGDMQHFGLNDLAKDIETLPEIQEMLKSMTYSQALSQLVNDVNQASTILRNNGNKEEAAQLYITALKQIESFGEINNSEMKDKIVEITQHIFGHAYNAQLQNVLDVINSSSVLSVYANQSRGQQNNNISMTMK